MVRTSPLHVLTCINQTPDVGVFLIPLIPASGLYLEFYWGKYSERYTSVTIRDHLAACRKKIGLILLFAELFHK